VVECRGWRAAAFSPSPTVLAGIDGVTVIRQLEEEAD
jgi:hypothetical protein